MPFVSSGQVLTNSSKRFFHSIPADRSDVGPGSAGRPGPGASLGLASASVAGRPRVGLGLRSGSRRCTHAAPQRGLHGSAVSTATAGRAAPLPGHAHFLPHPRLPRPLSPGTGCSVRFLLLLRILRRRRHRRGPRRSRRQPPPGHGRGPGGGWRGGRCGAPGGAGRARLPRVEEAPGGDGGRGRSFTPQAGGAAALAPARRQLPVPAAPAAPVHPARRRAEEERGRTDPRAFLRRPAGAGGRGGGGGETDALLGNPAAGPG